MRTMTGIVFGLVVVATVAEAQEVSLAGTVVNGTTGIAGAQVVVRKYPHLSATTGENGEFVISGALPVISGRTVAGKSQLPSIVGNAVRIPVSSIGTRITIDQYSLAGVRIATTTRTAKTSGATVVPLAKAATGVQCVNCIVGGDAYRFLMTPGFGCSTIQQHAAGRSVVSAAAAVADSLIVVARGYRNAIVTISDYQQTDVDVSLSTSNPWKPSGSLVHEKGMVKIMANGYDFEMGQHETYTTEEEDFYSEQPQHTVSFTSDFWMDTTEVTQKEYDTIMSKWFPDYVVPTMRTATFGLGGTIPAYYFYWDEAVLFCNAKSKEEGLDTVYRYGAIDGSPGMLCSFSLDVAVTADFSKNGYRLPTEAEWEYACRGGTSTDYYWGRNVDDYRTGGIDTSEIDGYAVWSVTSGSKSKGSTGFGIHAVATTTPNAYGVYDMCGNVSEFVHDEESFGYEYGSVTDPTGPANQSPTHIARGGNWMNNSIYLRSASRNLHYGEYPFYCVGFRTVRKAD